MNFKQHIILGIILSFIFVGINLYFKFFDISIIDYFIAVPFVIYYSILPDIDIGTSKSFKITFFGLLALLSSLLFLDYKYLIWLPIVLMVLILLLKHRGITHRFLFGLIISSVTFFINPILPIFCFIAYLSHIWIGDKV